VLGLRGQHFVEGDAFAESRGGDPRGAEGDDADDAFADAGVEPYPASVEVGIRDVREFIVFVALVTSVTKEPLEGEGRSNA
jgi:hypothetical protein